MLILLQRDADVAAVRSTLQGLGLWTEVARGEAQGTTALRVAPHSRQVSPAELRAVRGVADVLEVASAHPLVDAQAGHAVAVGKALVGGGHATVLMAGPCSVESEAQIQKSAELVARTGARFLRGGAFKPRTSPYGFRGHGRPALAWLRKAADQHGLGVVTEVLSEAEVEITAEHADLVQIGSRNMQNTSLLAAVGATRRPVLLKRGKSALVEEWLLAGEYLLQAGAAGVIFCERGVLGFDPRTRNLLDLGAVALLKHVLRLAVMADTSHAAGRADLIPPLSRAAVAAGADGLILEAHPDPVAALTDGAQALDGPTLSRLAQDLLAPGSEPR